jgi:hypothetical protein
MAGFVEGVDRGQSTLFPALLDDYVSEDNPVRVSVNRQRVPGRCRKTGALAVQESHCSWDGNMPAKAVVSLTTLLVAPLRKRRRGDRSCTAD